MVFISDRLDIIFIGKPFRFNPSSTSTNSFEFCFGFLLIRKTATNRINDDEEMMLQRIIPKQKTRVQK